MNRRMFCLSGVAATISSAAAGLACSPAAARTAPMTAASGPRIRLYKFIYDSRFQAARAFAIAAERAPSTAGTAAIAGDVTSLWSRDLLPRWSAGAGAIAGMTTARTLFCLEQLAKDHWMRVVVLAEHAMPHGRDIVHRLTAPGPMMYQIGPALAEQDWPTRMPAALAACRDADGAPMTCLIGSSGRDFGVTGEKLVSFVIS